MEASGLAAVDLQNKVALHSDMVQTVNKEDDETLLDYYASIITARKDKLLELSPYLVADAYFSKQPFVDELVNNGFEVVSRFRKDADLRPRGERSLDCLLRSGALSGSEAPDWIGGGS